MSAINVNSITGRTGTHGPVLTGVTTISSNLHVGSGLSVTGVSTFSNTVVGGATTELVVGGDARITGILTIGTGSVTIDGTSGNSSITGVTTVGITSAYITSINDLNYPTAGPLSNRNLIINGAMRVAQRGTSATGLGEGNSNTYLVDRFSFMESGTPTYQFTYSQDTDVPAGQGFSNSLKLLCTTADTSLTDNERLRIRQAFEGQDLQRIKKGTANAETLSLSFWIKSNLTGDVSVVLEDDTNARMISENATINAADTWEYKTIQFAGDTSGALNNDNALSIVLEWYFKAGSIYTSGTQQSVSWGDRTVSANTASPNNIDLGAAVNNYVNVTGVQLEVGSKATPFEHRPIGTELALCQRYYYKFRSSGELVNTARSAAGTVYWPVTVPTPMRISAPTIVGTTGLRTQSSVAGGGVTTDAWTFASQFDTGKGELRFTSSITGSANTRLTVHEGANEIQLDAEL